MKKFEKASVSIDLAIEMAKEAMKKASEIGLKISVSIVDESGVEKAFARMDGAPLISVETARKKAVLAVGFGIPTGNAWYNFIKDDPIFSNNSLLSQYSVEIQVMVTLNRLGCDGNGASVGALGRMFGISYGTVHNFTNRVFRALYNRRDQIIFWPNEGIFSYLLMLCSFICLLFTRILFRKGGKCCHIF
jgi:uncharacterized protein GlcG (DUF336 family)